MRKQSILRLKWSQVDLRTGCIRLAAQDVKQERAMVIPMTARVLEALQAIPRTGLTWVFLSEVPPKEGEQPKPRNDISKMFQRAITKAGMPDLWFHDLRRSFVTKARRSGIAESVVMRLSGHKTHAVFERYNIIAEDDLQEAIRQLDQGVGGANTVEPPAEELPASESLSS
jgi:integrase